MFILRAGILGMFIERGWQLPSGLTHPAEGDIDGGGSTIVGGNFRQGQGVVAQDVDALSACSGRHVASRHVFGMRNTAADEMFVVREITPLSMLVSLTRALHPTVGFGVGGHWQSCMYLKCGP